MPKHKYSSIFRTSTPMRWMQPDFSSAQLSLHPLYEIITGLEIQQQILADDQVSVHLQISKYGAIPCIWAHTVLVAPLNFDHSFAGKTTVLEVPPNTCKYLYYLLFLVLVGLIFEYAPHYISFIDIKHGAEHTSCF